MKKIRVYVLLVAALGWSNCTVKADWWFPSLGTLTGSEASGSDSDSEGGSIVVNAATAIGGAVAGYVTERILDSTIGSYVDEAIDDVEDAVGDGMDAVGDVARDVRHGLEDFASDVEDFAEDAMDAVGSFFASDGSEHDSDDGIEPLNEETAEALARQFAPLIYLHDKEPYRPASVEWYVERCGMRLPNGGGNVPRDRLDMADLRDYSGPEYRSAELIPEDDFSPTPKFYPTYKETFAGNPLEQNDDGSEECVADCYVNVVEKPSTETSPAGAVIQYFFFYPMNGPFGPRMGKLSIAGHEGDWEHIDVHLVKDCEGNFRPDKVYYAAHSTNKFGKVYWPMDQRMEWVSADGEEPATHPVAYSAKHFHASYPNHFYLNFVFDSTSRSGPIWKCWDHLKLVSFNGEIQDGAEWLHFSGMWGKDGIRGPLQKDQWRTEHPQRTRPVISIDVTVPKEGKMRASENFDWPTRFLWKKGLPPRAQELVFEVRDAETNELVEGVSFNVNQASRWPLFGKDAHHIYGGKREGDRLRQDKVVRFIKSKARRLYIADLQGEELEPGRKLKVVVYGMEG